MDTVKREEVTLVQTGYVDAATSMDAFGEFGEGVTPADIQKAHVLWAKMPKEDRHLVAHCFRIFDGMPEVFDNPPEKAVLIEQVEPEPLVEDGPAEDQNDQEIPS